jgi:iron only hydrogenase large subunit-like protein
MNNSSAVFISNIDDYLAPSQACVNPLYNSSNEKSENPTPNDQTESPPTGSIVVPRQRKRRPRATPEVGIAVVPAITKESKDPIKASMADCLACSGCVTTAETVLLEQQHSLTALITAMESAANKVLVATISNAVWADMLRHLQIHEADALSWRQKLAASLQDILQVSFVMDGNIPLEWTLLESAEEFCRAYQKKHNSDFSNGISPEEVLLQQWEQNNTPSAAVNSDETNYMLPNGTTQKISTASTLGTPNLPLLTSSCPALVCLAEKSTHAAVRHLSKTKSPMSFAGAWWRNQQSKMSSQTKIFHLAFMPCHDKKLEASRRDFLRASTEQPDVDLVLTTQEWYQLLVEHCQKKRNQGGELAFSDTSKEAMLTTVRSYLESLEPSQIQTQPPTQAMLETGGKVTLLSTTTNSNQITMQIEDGDDTGKDRTSQMDTDVEMEDVNTSNAESDNGQNSPFFSQGSGGLSEFVFRYAAWRLFNTNISHVPWKPVEMAPANSNRVVSARLRRAAAKSRDYFQATLYRHVSSDSGAAAYSCQEAPGAVPVLRFGIAYGLQTVQRILEPFQQSTKSTTPVEDTYAFDFVEAMACPSGCLNGGGQLRVADRETPTETRQRVALTRDLFVSSGISQIVSSAATDLPVPLPEVERRTRFHVVPPLQFSMGAVAGVAVSDTQW